jgi:transcriptional regulator with XRE-family HTH domain
VSEPPHGTNARYNSREHRCRCGPCRYAASQQRRNGRPFGDGDAVRAHIRELSAAGIGYRRVAELAGVTLRTVWRLLYEGTRPTAATAERILAVTADVGPAERWAPVLGTARRLQALRAIGWSNELLANRLGIVPTSASQLALMRRPSVRHVTAAATADLYEELSEVFPPMSASESRNRTFARERAWFPPIAWEPGTLDDPEALPCLLPAVEPVGRDLELAVQHVVAGHVAEPSREVIAEIARRMPDRRPREIAVVARCSPSLISHLTRRAAC